MKFLMSIALFGASVAAQNTAQTAAQTAAQPTASSSSGCLAEYIVTRCLQTENAKVQACNSTDYDCLCAAYQAVATCYNNCPDDPQAAIIGSQVTEACNNASLYGSSALASKTHTAAPNKDVVTSQTVFVTNGATVTAPILVTPSSGASAAPTASETEGGVPNTATFSASGPKKTSNDAAGSKRNVGVVLGAVGMIAALI